MSTRIGLVAVFASMLLGCSASHAFVDAGTSRDAPEDAALGSVCEDDEACSDGVFCNGAELCRPGGASDRFGCAAGAAPCLAGQTCFEEDESCRTRCDLTPDADGDGHAAIECGGDDCDDSRADVHPGAVEVCDAAAADEDCDAATLGDDADGDGHFALACCNGSVCGDDCDDEDPRRSPSALEICNGIDDDCNGLLDAPLEDRDRDGFADPSCGGTDCDDERGDIHPGAADVCDGVDSDCSSFTRTTDLDGDGYAADMSCAATAELAPGDCDEQDPLVHPGAIELCNGHDDDCDGSVDEGFDCDGVAQLDASSARYGGTGATCARLVSGQVACWGPSMAQGSTSYANQMAPAELVPGISDAVSIGVSVTSACAVRATGEVVCWGNDEDGIAPVSASWEPRPVAGITGASRVALGNTLACAIVDGGEVVCWGRARAGGPIGAPRRIAGLTGVVELEVSGDGAWAVTRDGHVWSRLAEAEGPRLVGGLDEVVEAVDSCALRRDRTVWCWGDAAPPAELVALRGAVDLESDRCARMLDGTVRCADAFARAFETPRDTHRLSAGLGHRCAIVADGGVVCWGMRGMGLLGDGGAIFHDRPVRVAGLADALDVVSSGLGRSCATRASGRVTCWGGEYGSVAIESWSPAEVAGFEDVRALDLDTDAMVAVRADGSVLVQGRNEGRFGTGSAARVDVPTLVPAWGSVRALALGWRGLVAVRTSGEVVHSGAGPAPRASSLVPMPAPELDGASSLASTGTNLCAALEAGVRCWVGGLWWDLEPIVVDASRGLALASSSRDGVFTAFCATAADGSVACAGQVFGPNPVATMGASDVAVIGENVCLVEGGEVWCVPWNLPGPRFRIEGFTSAVAVTGVDDTNLELTLCATLDTGEVWCRGDNSFGQLGDGRGGTLIAAPVTVTGLPRPAR